MTITEFFRSIITITHVHFDKNVHHHEMCIVSMHRVRVEFFLVDVDICHLCMRAQLFLHIVCHVFF